MGKLQVEKVWAQNNFIDFQAELDQKAVGHTFQKMHGLRTLCNSPETPIEYYVKKTEHIFSHGHFSYGPSG